MNNKYNEYLGYLGEKFNEHNFIVFVNDLLNLEATDINQNMVEKYPRQKQYKNTINYYKFIAKYTTNNDKIGVFIVKLDESSSTNARAMQRMFIAKLLSDYDLDASLVAFYSDNETSWRLSFVKKELNFTDKGLKIELTPAKRYSYLVGEKEAIHTAQEYLFELLKIQDRKITIADLNQVFDVEKVTKKFFTEYKEKYLQLKDFLDNNKDFVLEANEFDFTSEEFAKKLMGQIVFLYFLQKKGWLGVKLIPDKLNINEYKTIYNEANEVENNLLDLFYVKNDTDYAFNDAVAKNIENSQKLTDLSNFFVKTKYNMPWGTGDKKFVRTIYRNSRITHKDFFDDYLEPFFYTGLNQKRDNQYFPLFNCKIPFLNGGLFEPLNNYSWSSAEFNIPSDMFSNDSKTGILDIFDLYNFTIDEEEPLEKDIAVDPEMLGKIFENLLDVNDRKSTGSFYTPREIVQYMCQESLANFIVNKLNIPYEDINDFIKYCEIITQTDCENLYTDIKNRKLPDSIWNNLIELDKVLLNVKICDPAVGSGAFPLGMLNEIVKLRDNISSYIIIKEDFNLINSDQDLEISQRKRDIYYLKLQTIENSIYAVDLEPSAVDIAKLRLWLSLIVDFDNQLEPQPLPNLGCKIMQGNSLMDEFEGTQLFDPNIYKKSTRKNAKEGKNEVRNINIQTTMNFNDGSTTNSVELFDNLIKLQKEYFGASDSKTKRALKIKIEKIQYGLIEESLIDDSKKYNDFKKIEAKRNKPWFIWQLEFYDVFKNNDGFDIVIGNPPYGATFSKSEKETLSNKYPFVADYESSNYFISLSKTLLKANGNMHFIIPNMFMANINAQKFRLYLLNEWEINGVDNFSTESIFDSACVRNCIINLKNNSHKSYIAKFSNMKYINQRFISSSKDLKKEQLLEHINNWLGIVEEDETTIYLKNKIKHNSNCLNNFCDISQGLIPYDKYRGHTEYQIKNKVWNANYKKDNTYKKELKGKDVSRYKLIWNGIDWISYGSWLAAPRKIEFFRNERILIREITNPMINATITNEEYYNTPSIINCINFKIDIFYILGIINSKLMSYYHINNSPKAKKGAFPKILVNDVKNIPIVYNENYKLELSELVKSQLEKYDFSIDQKIDDIVYNIYSLNDKDIHQIETFFIKK